MSAFPDPILGANGFELTDAHRDDMRLSSRWTRFLGIFMLVGALLLLASLVFGIASLERQGLPSSLRTQVYISFMVVGVISFVNLFLGYSLFKYGKSLRNASTNLQLNGINDFFERQNTFWKFLGSYIGVTVLLYILLILFSI